MNVISAEIAEHYVWGNGCDGWHLIRRPFLQNGILDAEMHPWRVGFMGLGSAKVPFCGP